MFENRPPFINIFKALLHFASETGIGYQCLQSLLVENVHLVKEHVESCGYGLQLTKDLLGYAFKLCVQQPHNDIVETLALLADVL